MTEFQLTRRDALAAVAAAGGSLALSEGAVDRSTPGDDPSPLPALTDSEIATAQAVAEIVYPSAVEVTTVFVETYLRRLDANRTAGLRAAIDALNSAARRRHGKPFAAIDARDRRENLLRSLGVDRADSAADGTVAERIRYHLVNSLLYALFTTPKGSQLIGVSNPIGHPGGVFAHDD